MSEWSLKLALRALHEHSETTVLMFLMLLFIQNHLQPSQLVMKIRLMCFKFCCTFLRIIAQFTIAIVF